MDMEQRGWFAYAPLSDETLMPPAPAPAPARVPQPRADGQPVRPELADIARLGRRAVRGVVRAARSDMGPTLSRALRTHLGPLPADAPVVAESWQAYDHVNVQAGLEAWLAEPGRGHEVIGVTGFQGREFGLADLLDDTGPGDPWGPRPGNVATVNVACGPDSAVRPCVACAVYLVTDGDRRAALLLLGAEPHGMRTGVSLQVVATELGAAAVIAADIRRSTLQHNVFRGQVLSFGGEMFGPDSSVLSFHRRPDLGRSALVLPTGVMETIERQVVGVGRHRARLRASGQHLKRGLLLYGPPGTGKTHTVRYLLGRTPGVTVIQLTGVALHLIAEACSVARTLAPAMVVVEDVDLIAEDRGEYPGQHPLLFQLLNEMDGLAEDADVVFVLTTNRADVLEPALAARPGRVDQAVELGLPDTPARRALLELYRGALQLESAHLDHLAAQTEGVTASFLKELLRRAAVIAATAGDVDDPGRADTPEESAEPMVVTAADMDAALSELQDTRNAMTRVLLGGAGAG
jgi:SpoVK/Ycf46/Vps4 family AAA+-type ATPase